MDPSKCLAILHARNTSVDPEKEEFYKASFPETDDAPSAELTPPCEIDILIAMDTISLMNIITTLQGERVQVIAVKYFS